MVDLTQAELKRMLDYDPETGGFDARHAARTIEHRQDCRIYLAAARKQFGAFASDGRHDAALKREVAT